MRKSIGAALLATFLLLAVLLFAGCGGKATDVNSGQNSADSETTRENMDGAGASLDSDEGTDISAGTDAGDSAGTDAGEGAGETVGGLEPKAFDMDILAEMYSEEGSIDIESTEEYSYEFSYSYHIPEITEESNGAREINALLHEAFDYTMEEFYRYRDNMESENAGSGYDDGAWYDMQPSCYDISYEAYWNGSILSLVVKAVSSFEDFVGYEVYNYDAALGEVVTNEELLAMHRISEEDFITLARVTAVKECNDIMEENLRWIKEQGDYEDNDLYEGEGIYVEFLRCRMNTIQDEHLDVGMPLYLNGDGDLCIIACVSVPAGGGSFFESLVLARDLSLWDELKKVEVLEEYQTPGFNQGILQLYDGEGYSAHVMSRPAGDAYEVGYYIGFDGDDPSVFIFQVYVEDLGASEGYTGSLELIGMDVDGYLFAYELDTVDGKTLDNSYKGKFYLNPFWYYDEDADLFMEIANYLWVEGDDVMDTDGNVLRMEKSYG